MRSALGGDCWLGLSRVGDPWMDLCGGEKQSTFYGTGLFCGTERLDPTNRASCLNPRSLYYSMTTQSWIRETPYRSPRSYKSKVIWDFALGQPNREDLSVPSRPGLLR